MRPIAHACQVLAAQLLFLLVFKGTWAGPLTGRHRWSSAGHIASRSPAMQPTTESLPPLAGSKMPETPATAVRPLNGSSKDGPSTISQQFGRIPKEPQECSSPDSSIATVAATGVVSRCSQVL